MRRWPITLLVTIAVLATGSPVRADSIERTTKQLAQAVETWTTQAKTQWAGYEAGFHRDPLQPLVDGQGHVIGQVGGLQSGVLSVQGIIWSQEHPMAVIGDELVGEGATVGRYTVTKILQDRVEVQAGSETKVVMLDRGVTTKPATPATP